MKKFICNLFLSLISILRIIRFSKKTKLPVEEHFNECIILGNGPSLGDSLQKKIEKIQSISLKICVNSMAINKYYEILKPQYYILADPDWSKERVSTDIADLREKVANAILEKTTWRMTLFIPVLRKGECNFFEKKLHSNKNIKVVYYNCLPVDGFNKFKNFCYKYNIASPHIQNVLIAAIYLSINIGFKNIYLVGADHTWMKNIFVNEKNVLLLCDKHFYDNESINAKPWYKDGEEIDTFKMHEIMLAMYKTFSGYYVLKEYAKLFNANIYNCSEISYIDAFERRKL